MRFLSVRELRGRSADIWQELPIEREMVVTNNGHPVAILTTVGESDVEESLAAIRSARASVAVTQLQRRSIERGLDKLSVDDINAEIMEARRSRVR